MIREHQIVQAGSSNPLGHVPLPYKPKNTLPHGGRRLPRIPLQEKLGEGQLQHVLPQKEESGVAVPHVPRPAPLTRLVLKRQIQKRVKLSGGVALVAERVGGLQRVPQRLLHF